MRKVSFYTLGCKVNQYETNGMIQQFQERGYEITEFEDVADIYIINTCTVSTIIIFNIYFMCPFFYIFKSSKFIVKFFCVWSIRIIRIICYFINGTIFIITIGISIFKITIF